MFYNMISFKNRLVFITGATSGIGKAITLQLAKEGANLIIADKNNDDLIKTQAECKKFTNFCETITFDLSNPNEVNQAATTILEKYGPVYLLVNNGGISQRSLAHETP